MGRIQLKIGMQLICTLLINHPEAFSNPCRKIPTLMTPRKAYTRPWYLVAYGVRAHAYVRVCNWHCFLMTHQTPSALYKHIYFKYIYKTGLIVIPSPI